ncbi:MAG: hypothetical protein ACXWZR_18540 [Mycobacterium sp.]
MTALRGELLVVRVILLHTHLVHVRMGMGLLPVRVHMVVLHVFMVMGIMRVAVPLAAMRMNVRVRLFVRAAHRCLPMLEMTLTVPPTQRTGTCVRANRWPQRPAVPMLVA